jgi:Concanavalin A-like lectin/glucanases superfamily
MSYADVVLADGPIGFWPLKDWLDASGHSYTLSTGGGAPVAGQAPIAPGDSGGDAGSTHFDGSSYLGGVIFRYTYPPDAQSAECWIKTTANGAFLGAYPSYRLLVSGGKFAVQQHNGTNLILASSGPDVNDGQPHHVVAAWSSQQAVKLYVDGVLAGSGDCWQTTWGGPPQAGSVGAYGDGPWFTGDVQDLATYAYELTSGQVAAHFDAGSAPPATTWEGGGSGASSSDGTAAATIRSPLAGSAEGSSASEGSAAATVRFPPEVIAELWWEATDQPDWWNRNPYHAEALAVAKLAAQDGVTSEGFDAWWEANQAPFWNRNPYHAEVKEAARGAAAAAEAVLT